MPAAENGQQVAEFVAGHHALGSVARITANEKVVVSVAAAAADGGLVIAGQVLDGQRFEAIRALALAQAGIDQVAKAVEAVVERLAVLGGAIFLAEENVGTAIDEEFVKLGVSHLHGVGSFAVLDVSNGPEIACKAMHRRAAAGFSPLLKSRCSKHRLSSGA